MGVDNISDSISLSKQNVEKRIVMPSEVTTIPTLNFYIHLTDYDVSKDKLDIVFFPKKSQSYIGREDLLFKKMQSTRSSLSDKSSLFQDINTADEQSKYVEDPDFLKLILNYYCKILQLKINLAMVG
jgi:hypothetical protein